MKLKLSTLIVVLAVISLYSCSGGKPLVKYNEINIENISNNIDLVPIDSSIWLKPGLPVRSELSNKDSVFRFGSEISYYDLFAYHADSNKQYDISVISLCDCMGFKKYMFIPEILVFDDSKNVFFSTLDTAYYNAIVGEFSLRKDWTTPSISGSSFYVLVYSNNKVLDQTFHSERVQSYVYTGSYTMHLSIPVNIRSSLEGKFLIKICESSSEQCTWYTK